MSDTETDLSSNSEEENDGGYSREESFVKDLFTVYFLSEANSSGIKSCRNGMDASANEVKIQIYNTFQIGVNKILLDSILHHASLDETTISILKDEAMRDVEIMSKTVSDDVEAVDIRLTQSTAHDEPPAEQMQSASASISSDGDASTMSNGSSEVLASNNVGGHRREREPSEDSDNPRPQQRRRGNKSTTHTIAAPLSFDEATFKQEAKAQVDAFVDKFASINHHQDRVRPIAFEARLLQMMQCKIKDAFTRDEPNLKQDLYNILRHTFQVLRGNDMCRQRFVNILRREAEVRDSVQSYSDAQSHGDLLNILCRTRDQNDDFNLSLDGIETEVTSAVQQWINSDSGSSEAREVSTDEVKEFSIHRKSTKNVTLILLKLCTAATVISQFSMREALLHSPMCIQDLAADLYRVKCGSELDSSSVNLLQFIQTVIIPLLKEEAHKWKAVKLTLEIRELLTNSTRVDRQRENLQEVRKALILEKFRSSQRQSLAGDGRIVGESVDYFGADQPWEKHLTERRSTMTPFFNLLLAETIEGKMPPRLLQSRGGFALAMLRMSWSDLTNKCNFASKAFLGKDEADFCSTYSEAYLQKKKKLFSDTLLKVKKQKNDTSFGGEKKLIIFSTEQMQSLVALADF